MKENESRILKKDFQLDVLRRCNVEKFVVKGNIEVTEWYLEAGDQFFGSKGLLSNVPDV